MPNIVRALSTLNNPAGIRSVASLISNKRSHTGTAATSVTPNIDNNDIYKFTALSAGITINAHTGTSTPTEGRIIEFVFHDDGSSRAFTWNGEYRTASSGGATLPTATTTGKTNIVRLRWNSIDSKFDCIQAILI